jgi:alpha-aminoadipic semialdehyde synthase
VAFGVFAGQAGMIDGLHGFGLRLLAEGISTPLLTLPNTYMHASLTDARAAVVKVGEAIAASDGGI